MTAIDHPKSRCDWRMLSTIVLAIAIGGVASLLAKLFLLAIEWGEKNLHPVPLADLALAGGNISIWDAAALILGGLVVGWMTRYWMPGHQNRALSHVVEDVHYRRGDTGVREGLAVGLISALSMGVGASVGRYGPAVHLGTSAAGAVSRFFRLRPEDRLTLSCAGIAAAIAASFSAPLAAVVFVQEVVLRQWRLHQFIPVAAAAVAGAHCARSLGVHFVIPAGVVPDAVGAHEWLFFGILGLACGGVAIAFNQLLPRAAAWVASRSLDDRWKPALGGMVLAGIGLLTPAVLGQGTEITQQAIAGQLAWAVCLLFLVLKFAATQVSLASGFHGGVFGPSLFLGAMLGSAVGSLVAAAGVPVASTSLYALAGMGAMFSGIVGAVFASILGLIEMTGKLSPSLPLLFAVCCTYLVIYLSSQSSLIVLQLEARGRNPFTEVHGSDPKYIGRQDTPAGDR